MTEVQKYISELQNDYYWYGRAEAEEEEAIYQAEINRWIDECIGTAKTEYDNAYCETYHKQNLHACRVRQGKALAAWKREHRYHD